MTANMASMVTPPMTDASGGDFSSYLNLCQDARHAEQGVELLLSSASVWLTDSLLPKSGPASHRTDDDDEVSSVLDGFPSNSAVADDAEMDSIFPFLTPESADTAGASAVRDCLLDLDGVDFDVDELMPPDRPVFDDGDDDDADEDLVMSSSLTSSVDQTPPPQVLPRRGRGKGGGFGRKSKSSNMRTKGEANREAAYRYRAKQRQSNSLAKSRHSQLVADNQRLEAEVASAESQLQFLLHLCRRRPTPAKKRLQLRILEADEDCDPPQLGSKPKLITMVFKHRV
ncbi:hypothetical protein BOX15_Mlig009232g2 [Macrostomum lignano]|uniref:BZIP domain-containing protein n=1 Tax=Macrostomum lignano TaxID=282301 RepID=A0A267FIJ0_9PLAT|nr:hypothetical protein BOX15_Mlig009232g2 [Macrostomum lignano]